MSIVGRGRLLAASGSAILVGVVAPTSRATAHIGLDPPESPTGRCSSIGFRGEHDWPASPTVQLAASLSDGAIDGTPEPRDRWSGGGQGDALTFRGEPGPDDVPLTFGFLLTRPPTTNPTEPSPFVQRCEIRSIDPPTGIVGVDPPDAAMTLIGAGVPPPAMEAATRTSAATSSVRVTADAQAITTAAVDATPTSATIAPSTTSATSGVAGTALTNGAAGTASESGAVVFVAVVAVVVGLGALVMWRARRPR